MQSFSICQHTVTGAIYLVEGPSDEGRKGWIGQMSPCISQDGACMVQLQLVVVISRGHINIEQRQQICKANHALTVHGCRRRILAMGMQGLGHASPHSGLDS